MSRRKRRKSCRRKSSSSSKQSISPYNFQKHTKNLVDTVVHGEETAEKGETDSFCKENTLSESEEEKESPSKEKKNRRGSYEDIFQEKNKKASVSEHVDRDTDLKITHSVTVDNFGLSSPRVVFERCHETSVDGTVSSVIAITTTEVRCMTSNMRLEINEVVTLNDSDFKTTLILQNDRQKGVQTKFKTQTEKHQNPKTTCFSPWNQNGVDHKQNVNHHGNVSYKISIAELSAKHNDAGSSQSSWDCPEDWDCHKSCCKNNFCGESTGGQTDTDFTLVDGSSCSSSASDFWQPQKQLSLPTSLSNDALWNIPPPDEFADEKDDVLDDLAENVALFQISHKKDFNDHEDSESTHTASEDFSCCKEFMYQNSLDGDKMKNDEICCGSGLSPQEQLFMSRTVSINRSSFTKNFIHNHERRTKLRNNSIGIIETKTHSSSYMDIPRKRRKTFPAMSYHLSQGRESIPSHRESFSSGTLYSFFMHSLPFQAERMGRFCVEDERLCLFGAESRKSSSSSSYGPSSSSTTGLDCFPKLKAYSTIKNPFYPSRSDESPEEVFFRGEQYYEPQQDKDFEVSDATMFMDGADADNNLAGPQEQNEVNESGFDEEMIEVDETIPDGDTLDSQKNFLIHIIPPSPCNSEEHINEGVANKLRSNTCEEEKGEVGQKRRGSVLTIITGDCEQRFIHVNSPDEGVSQEDQIDAFSTKCDSPIMSFTQNLEMDNTREPMIEGISQAQEIKISEDCLSEESTVSVVQLNTSFQQPEEDITGELINDNQKMDNVGENAQVQRNKVSHQINEASDKVSADLCRTHMLYKNDSSERHNGSKCSLEVKEHLRPPADSIHKDSEENSDRWAKRRKLFKESKQRSSAGGSSITSNITEESDTINSEDTRSVDILMQDIEERGFYTEIFHSASWIYRGDDVTQNDGPNCLSNRARPAAIRERTVKIGKGMGDYPWGFRIQFSKPIVVTEVDTNGAAEEAGLQVGDYVLAVNGTDVTSVPHSEAADLARQGPDLLTLIIGSDIGRTPNTPRPACRGYLHKRTQSSLLKGWRKRWFVLRHDCCLYYYRNKRDEGKSRALSAVSLEGAVVEADSSLGKPFVFKCCPVSGTRVYYFCATSNQEMKRWVEAMGRAVHPITQNHVWVHVTRHNSSLPPLAIKNPECLGLLHQLDRNKDSWVQHYCVLKDACLYFYASIRSTCAIGGIYLHGYTVREQPLGSKRSTIELRPPSEEFKAFSLCAENANENKRWISAIKSSVGKWLPLHQAIQDYMSRPPEETRM